MKEIETSNHVDWGRSVDLYYFHVKVCAECIISGRRKIQSHAFASKRIRYNVEQCSVGSTQGNVEMSGISRIAKPNFPLQDVNMNILGNSWKFLKNEK